jgi:hypothetical protein
VSSFGAWLVGLITKYVLDYFAKMFQAWKAQQDALKANHDEAAGQAAQDTEKLKEAATSDDGDKIDEAIDDSLSHL